MILTKINNIRKGELAKKFYKKKALNENKVIDNKKYEICIFTIAFNNVDVIKYQIKFIKKNCMDNDIKHIVVDNSTSQDISNKIKSLCIEEDIEYYKLPQNPFSLSNSHGAAVNWVCKNIIDKIKVKYVGFLDHDCFLIKKIRILDRIKELPFYGLYQERQDKWYLWPGFCFFNLEMVNLEELDFMPNEWGDTGASNWKIYQRYSRKEKYFSKYRLKKICDIGEEIGKQATSVEYFDESWLHLSNASNWMQIQTNEKEIIINNIITNYLSE